MKNDIKSKIGTLLDHYGNAVNQQDEERARALEARKKFEAAVQNAITTVIVPAAEQVKAEIEPNGWKCAIRPSPLSVTVDIFQGNMTAAGGGPRPNVLFKAADHANVVHTYIASQKQSGGEDKSLSPSDITEEVVQGYLAKLIERLVQEGPPHQGDLNFTLRQR